MMTIKELHIKPVKKEKARSMEKVKLIADFGPEGDAYGGPGDRQITILGVDDLAELEKDREKGLCIHRFTPNITVSGSSADLKKGKSYRLGGTEIRITDISKKCHEGCSLIEEEKRICLLPKTARFAAIEKEGTVSLGDNVEEI